MSVITGPLVAFFVLSVALFCTEEVSANEPCQPNDYEATYDACAAQHRRKWYKRIASGSASDVCDGPSIIDFNETVSCLCGLDEITPITSKCDARGTQTITGYVPNLFGACNLPPDNANALKQGVVSCSCGPSDVGSAFTQCVNGTRSVVYYWTRDCDVDTFKLPIPILAPCEIACRAGTFLAPPYPVCQKCPAGTVSFAGYRLLPPYRQLPNELMSTCTHFNYVTNSAMNDCQSWTVSENGQFLHSGVNTVVDDMESKMSLAFDIVSAPARLSFDYFVSSEQDSDFFQVQLDGNVLLDVSGDHNWQEFVYDIPVRGAACFMSVLDSCLETNQLLPYRPSSFFTPSKLAPFTFVDIKANPCVPDSFTSVANTASIAFVADATICDISQILAAAQSKNVAGIILGTPNPISGSSKQLPAAMIVASMDMASAKAFQIKLNGKEAGATPGTVTTSLVHDPTPGERHHLTFIYWKDFSRAVGEDRAKIRNLKIKGATFYSVDCEPCPAGQGSVPGSGACESCEANTFAATPGTPLPCTPCPAGHVAPPGSTGCASSGACTVDDYSISRSECRMQNNKIGDWVHDVGYVLVQPPMCNTSAPGGFVPPQGQTLGCPDCAIGQYRTLVGKCDQCPPGQVTTSRRQTAIMPCASCWAGMFPQRTLAYDNFDLLAQWPANWARTATHNVGSGWSLATTASVGGDAFGHTAISVGRGILGAGTASFDVPINTYLYSTVSVTYFTTVIDADVAAALANAKLEIILRDNDTTIAGITSSSSTESYFLDSLPLQARVGTAVSTYTTIPIAPGGKILTFRFRNLSPDQPSGVIVSLVAFSVAFESSGGGERCVACPAGYACPQYAPFPIRCGPGTRASVDKTTCDPCLFDTYSVHEANTECLRCPTGFQPSPNHDYCVLPPALWAPDSYIWTPHPYNITEDALAPIRKMKTPLGHLPHASFNVTHFVKEPQSFIFRTGRNEESTGKIYLSPFMPGNRVGPCEFPSGVKAYGCLHSGNNVATGGQVSLGGIVNPTLMRYGGANDSRGIMLTYDGGQCNEDPTRRMRTVLQIQCDPTIVGHQLIRDGLRVQTCLIDVRMVSKHACALCSNESFVYTESECDRSTLTRHLLYSWADTEGNTLSRQTCADGLPLPDIGTASCPWMTFELGKQLNDTWVMIGIILFLFLALVVVVVHLYLARKKLGRDYEALRSTIPREMELAGSHSSGGRRGGRRAQAAAPPAGDDVIEIADDDNDPLPVVHAAAAGAKSGNVYDVSPSRAASAISTAAEAASATSAAAASTGAPRAASSGSAQGSPSKSEAAAATS